MYRLYTSFIITINWFLCFSFVSISSFFWLKMHTLYDATGRYQLISHRHHLIFYGYHDYEQTHRFVGEHWIELCANEHLSVVISPLCIPHFHSFLIMTKESRYKKPVQSFILSFVNKWKCWFCFCLMLFFLILTDGLIS